MERRNLLSIGSFAMLSGLTIPALRHYDEVDVLKPAEVDARTGYRYYSPAQVRGARLIRTLRAIDLPVDEIRDLLDAKDEEHVRAVLVEHRDRLRKRADVLTQQVQAVDEYIEKGVTVPEVKGNRIVMINVAVHDAEVAKKFYEDTFGVEFFVQDHEGQIADHYEGTFGTWPTDNFFLMQIFTHPERAGTANFGFSCEDLDATYKKSIAAGAIDVHGPKDLPGMPRVAAIKDPSGNDIGLYQG